MEPGRWGRITDIYHATIARPPEERASFLGDECHGDDSLRKRVEAMVKSHERSGDFIESPAFAVAPELLIDEPTGDLIGQSIGHYRIESLLGVGGMGEVYLARDELLGRKVALKFLPEHLTAEATQLNRFKTEARTASALNHPNILTVHEIGAENTRQFIATEFIEGITLRALLARGRMNLHDALEIAVQVASALDAAHETGVVHRDIKPENIMLRPDGYAKVLDFGIAKLTEQHSGSDFHEIGTTTLQTQPGLLLGTAHYMSPEQTRGQTVDARSDIWSLGVVLYEMVGGIPPFRGETPSDCIASILKTEPPLLCGVVPDVPLRLQCILQKALRKNRDERYQTIKEMLAHVRSLERELETEGSSPQTEARAAPILRKIKRHKRGVLLTLAAALFAAAALAYHFYFVSPAPSPTEKSIAVLPFKPLLAASRDESLEIGMADTLITKLGSLRQIIVRPVSAVRKYTGLEQDPLAAGREQRVDAVLDGTLQKSGERIRVTVRLLSAADGQQLWADKFEEEFTDIFSVEDSISERVAAALAVTLTGADKKQLTKRYTENAEAYQLYLKGRYYAGKYTPEGTKKAIAYFDKAIALDPNYALAYDGLAYCYYASDWFGPPKENFAKGRALVEKALEIDPGLVEAHVSLGLLVAWLDYDWPGAEREFKRAFELNANYPPAHLWYGYYLMSLGNFDQSIAEIKRAIELDPLSAEANTCLGIALLDGHRYDEALQQLRTTVEAEPDYWLAHLYFARALEKKGELSAAIAELKKTTLIEGAPAEVVSALGYAYAVSGNKAEAEKIILQLKEQSEQSKQFYVPAYGIATIYAGLGDKERAFAYLEKEYANGAFYLNYLKVDPEVDNLRSDPRFADLLRRVRLAP
jgi:serine/threonine-protein kinase